MKDDLLIPDPMVLHAADCVDALTTARRAKRLITLILFLILLGQLAVFLTLHFSPELRPAAPTTQDATRFDLLAYGSALALYVGMLCTLALPLVLAFTAHVMLVGRLLGTGLLGSAFVWSLVLALILFPWQTILATQALNRTDFIIPGVLATWREVTERVPLKSPELPAQMLYWGRFVGAPVVAMLILLIVHLRSGRGLRRALAPAQTIDETPIA